MLRFLLGFGIFMLWLVWARNYYVCQVLGQCGPKQSHVDSTLLQNIPHTLKLMTGDYAILEGYPQFYFDFGSHAYTYVDGNEKFLSKVASFMNEHPKTTLLVRGYYLDKEKTVIDNSHYYSDLGLARAYTIINKLVEEYQIPKGRIKAISELAIADPIVEPLQFDIYGYRPPQQEMNKEDTVFLQQIKTSIKNITYDDKLAKFEYNSEVFKPSPSFGVYVDSLITYFQQNEKDYLLIIGHTDSKGNEAYNQKLGLKRANAVKNYLSRSGLTATIKTTSKGESEPKETDRDDNGRYKPEAMAKNRRVNILIKSRN